MEMIILIVEDNFIAAQLEKMIFEKLNCTVDTVMSGEEAVELAKKNTYSFIIMDIGLPGIDGVQACERIRLDEQEANKPMVPIVAVTANTDPEQHLLCKKSGMQDVFSKPFTIPHAQKILDFVKQQFQEGVEE
jgi:CheY-like chemotaxis protein